MAGFLDLTGLSHFKTKLLEAVNATFLTQKDASATYLGINAKAKSAAKADSAGSATKATLDGNGANIAATYLPLSGGTLLPQNDNFWGHYFSASGGKFGCLHAN